MSEVRLYGGGESGLSAYEEYVLAQQDAGAPVLSRAAWLASLRGDVGVVIDPDAVAWDVAANYATRAVTTDAGSTWIAKRPTTGERPSLSPDAWAVLVPGVDLAFADQTKTEVAALGDQKKLEVATIGNEKIAEAQAQVGLASTARVGSETARTLAQAAQAAAEAAALNMGAVAYATAAALPGAPAANAKGYVYADLTPANNGLWFWGAAGPWVKDTLSPAAAADLLAETLARQALVTGDATDMGHVIRNLLGFVIAQFTEAGDVRSKYLSISATGERMEFRDALGFHIATIGNDGVTIKGGSILDARPGGDWIVADPLGFHLISVINGRLYLKGREVVSGSADALIASAPEVELARTGILRRGPADLIGWRAARGNMLAGLGRARILCLGDSNTAGDAPAPGVRLRSAAYPTRMAQILNRVYGATADGFCGNAGILSAADQTYDPRVDFGIGWVVSGAVSIGGTVFSNSTTTNPMTFTPNAAWDACEVVFTGIAAGEVDLSIGGSVERHTISAGSMVSVTYDAGSLGGHTLNIARASGEVHVAAILPHSTTVRGVEVINAGRTGWKASDLIDTTNFYSPGNALAEIGADVVLIEIGLNDFNTNVLPLTFGANLQVIIDLCPANADVVIMSSVTPDQGARAYLWSAYLAQMRAVADANGIPFIDMTIALGARDAVEGAGLTNDGLHPNYAGLAEKAHVAAKLFTI